MEDEKGVQEPTKPEYPLLGVRLSELQRVAVDCCVTFPPSLSFRLGKAGTGDATLKGVDEASREGREMSRAAERLCRRFTIVIPVSTVQSIEAEGCM